MATKLDKQPAEESADLAPIELTLNFPNGGGCRPKTSA